jgi:hypothetical protein
VPRSAFDQRDRYAGDLGAEHSEGGQPATHPCASRLRSRRRRAGMRRAAGHCRVRVTRRPNDPRRTRLCPLAGTGGTA